MQYNVSLCFVLIILLKSSIKQSKQEIAATKIIVHLKINNW